MPQRNMPSPVVIALAVSNVIFLMMYLKLRSGSAPSSCHTTANQVKPPPFTVDDHLYLLYGEGRADEKDPALLRHIDSRLSRPNTTRPRSLLDKTGKKHFSQIGQSEYIDNRLKQRRNGFFVECGAFQGEGASNSLFFELERNWTGLLIEANPYAHRHILTKNRNAFVLNACLSTKKTPGHLKFQPADVLGGIVDNIKDEHNKRIKKEKLAEGDSIQVECFSLNSIMAAIGVTHIDYFSLDVEGAEVEILKTIDWNRLTIDIMTIEYPVSTGGLDGVRSVFKPLNKYKEVANMGSQDVVFERI